MENQQFAGFWIRVLSHIIDSIVLLLILVPIAMMMIGGDWTRAAELDSSLTGILLNYVCPALFFILFWHFKSATPGKMILGLKIIDASNGGSLSIGKCVIRYLGYIISIIPICLGFIWVGFDKQKQGWHDKIAGTYVVLTRS